MIPLLAWLTVLWGKRTRPFIPLKNWLCRTNWSSIVLLILSFLDSLLVLTIYPDPVRGLFHSFIWSCKKSGSNLALQWNISKSMCARQSERDRETLALIFWSLPFLQRGSASRRLFSSFHQHTAMRKDSFVPVGSEELSVLLKVQHIKRKQRGKV